MDAEAAQKARVEASTKTATTRQQKMMEEEKQTSLASGPLCGVVYGEENEMKLAMKESRQQAVESHRLEIARQQQHDDAREAANKPEDLPPAMITINFSTRPVPKR